MDDDQVRKKTLLESGGWRRTAPVTAWCMWRDETPPPLPVILFFYFFQKYPLRVFHALSTQNDIITQVLPSSPSGPPGALPPPSGLVSQSTTPPSGDGTGTQLKTVSTVGCSRCTCAPPLLHQRI